MTKNLWLMSRNLIHHVSSTRTCSRTKIGILNGIEIVEATLRTFEKKIKLFYWSFDSIEKLDFEYEKMMVTALPNDWANIKSGTRDKYFADNIDIDGIDDLNGI